MTPPSPYPIGTPGTPWGPAERAAWLARQPLRRSYADEVLAPLQAHLPPEAELLDCGTLDHSALGLGQPLSMYPLRAVRSRQWRDDRPTVLVTGGVHGYETSGVQGALRWLALDFARHAAQVNLLLLPCISPWGYETINRWNPAALDPNRNFRPDSPVPEAAWALACVARHAPRVDLHIDLHETTDTDNSEFEPAKAARDGKQPKLHPIPDGFYLVADTERPEPDFQTAAINAVRQVTHIAEPDEHGRLIGSPMLRPGVIAYAKRALGLCGGMTGARFVTTTEVYPDSARTSVAECNEAQRVAVNAAVGVLVGG